MAIGAQVSVSIPGTPVPQSLQTLAVVLVGAWLGAGRAAAALLVYVAVGAAGLPVFADGASGLEHLWGPTAGYLAGFVAGAALVGWWVGGRGAPSKGGVAGDAVPPIVSVVLAAVIAHALILGLGWARLALMIGARAAFDGGVAPFLMGGVVKSVVAAAVVVLGARLRPGRAQAT